jgi:phenylacetate-CoA ligase
MTSWLARLWGTFYIGYHYLGQSRYPYRPLAQIIADRDRRVRRMVAYAYRYVPYYRETMRRLELTPGDFRGFDDLARLPLLDRADFQRDPAYFTSTAQPLSSYFASRSSGTTGRPSMIYLDRRALLQDAAYGERARAVMTPLLGRAVGYRLMALMAGRDTNASRTQRYMVEQALWPRGVSLQRQELSLYDPPEVNVALINDYKPDVIQGFGSAIGELFMYLKASGAPFHHPTAIRYTSDALPDSARRVIQEEFGIPVFSRYDAAELPTIGFECERHSGLHLNIDLCPLRIVDADGRTLPPGEPGEVIVSNLISRGTVLLNHRPWDRATLLPEPCTCGRTLPLLSHPQGRHNDWLTLPSGRRMHGQRALSIFRSERLVWQYQVTQETPSRFRVLVVVDEALDRAALVERLRRGLPELLGEPVEVEVQFVEAVPRTPGGKVRTVMSLVGKEQSAP